MKLYKQMVPGVSRTREARLARRRASFSLEQAPPGMTFIDIAVR
ncbi:hypothetical protein ACSFA7_07815 [Variovorax sp. LT1R20]